MKSFQDGGHIGFSATTSKESGIPAGGAQGLKGRLLQKKRENVGIFPKSGAPPPLAGKIPALSRFLDFFTE